MAVVCPVFSLFFCFFFQGGGGVQQQHQQHQPPYPYTTLSLSTPMALYHPIPIPSHPATRPRLLDFWYLPKEAFNLFWGVLVFSGVFNPRREHLETLRKI